MSTDRDMQIRILAEPSCDASGIVELARAHTSDAAGVSIVTEPEQLRLHASGVDDLDLLHVPSGQELARSRGALLARSPGSARVGVLSEDEGLFVPRVPRDAFERFLSRSESQADRDVYVEGAKIRALSAEDADIPLPRQVYLGLTQRCNRSCSFCVSRTFAEDMLTVDEVRGMAQELVGEVDVVALTGAGEAMVHPDFWEVFDMLVETLPGVTFKMNTSGIALRYNAERLVEYPVKNITVSLNAGTKETYERVVGRGFAAALRGIETLVVQRARAGRDDLRLCISLVLMNSTVAELEEVVKIAFDLGVEEVQGIYLMINDAELADESPWHHPERSNELLRRAQECGRALGVETSLPPEFRTGKSARGTAQKTSLPTEQGQHCVEPWSTAYIRPDGEVLPCPYFEDSLGSIRSEPLATVWQGKGFQELRSGLARGQARAECRHCCGFNEGGSVDDYASHWIGTRRPEQVPE